MDDDEFARWLAEATPRLSGAALLLTGDRHAADDLLQDALVRVYERRDRIAAGACTAYARRVLATRAVDASRRPWRREIPVAALPDLPQPGDAESPVDLVAALRRLPARQRAVLVLRFYDDLDVEQTADVLGITTGTVKSQTSRGLDRLRELVGPLLVVGPERETT